MRVSAIILSGLAAIALAAPVEVSSGLAERQYDIAALRLPAAEGAGVEKRQYRPTVKIGKGLEGEEADVEKRQYAPATLGLSPEETEQ
ncbi:hypothetical protein Hte_000426 [Hypoxylon texense]